MRIMLVDVNYGSSSTGKIVADLFGHLTRLGHEVLVCYGRGPQSEEMAVHKFSGSIEFLIHALLSRLIGLNGMFSPIATYRLKRKVRRFKPDVVHLHDLHGFFLNYFSFLDFLKEKKIPVVWTFHSEFMITGNCGATNGCEKWKVSCDSCPQKSTFPETWIFDFSRYLFFRKKRLFQNQPNISITTPSTWLAHNVAASPMLGSKSIIKTVPNGVDCEIFRVGASQEFPSVRSSTEEFIVIAVGANLMSSAKGGSFVIELAARLPDMTFLLVGATQGAKKLPSNVTSFGVVSDKAYLANLYEQSDLTLVVSKSESFSMVCAESLACGTPIAGFKSGGPEEVAPPGYGFFVEYGDNDALEHGLKRIHSGEEQLQSSSACASWAKQQYGLEIMTERFLHCYEEAIFHYE